MGRGSKPLKRGRAKRPELRRVLIYCEGECTEKHYLLGLRSDLHGLPVQIVLGSEYGVPTALVRAAVKHQDRAPHSRQDRFTPYDEVWCVMDVEAPIPHPDPDRALAEARRHGIKVALSNPCFELWLLLHFQGVGANAHPTSKAAQKLLEKYTECGYRADHKHLEYAPFRSSHAVAAQRARALRDLADDGYRANPWTDVDLLVDQLLEQQRIARR